jgi:hypothetical protein
VGVERQTVDLSGYPDLVVIYLGMRVRRPRGLLRLLGLGPQIQKSRKEKPGGTGFWHEAYFARGGIDAIYDDMTTPTGLARFAPQVPARGAMFGGRRRVGREGGEPGTVVTEAELYGDEPGA